ncbi:tetratricopeptide repeat protein [Croceicoccus estronivorus]|uniref:tetratricopeptide repeat protein n=1 Tax=Croceicoccus estronivorus TaxID=1172626 RepID=UPI0009ED93EB|nr:tetratricopeptide repeat protein [Croceicoccus estronivorus]
MAEDNALLREVDEAVFQDQMLVAAKRFGIPLLAVVLAGLLAFGGYLWWQESREDTLENNSEELVRAVDNISAGHFDTADKALAPVAENSAPGVEAAAKLLRAGIAVHDGRKEDALKLYTEVAQDKSVPAPYRDIATIRGVAANFDAMKPEDVIAKLKPLAVPGNPWFGSAGELVGVAYLKQGKTELAGPLFAAIAKDEDVPDSLRSRTRQLAGMLGFDAITDAETFVKGAEAGPPATSAQ